MYSFELKTDSGSYFISVISYNKKSAIEMVMKAEGCPKRAIKYIKKISTHI